MDYQKSMLGLHLRAAPKETLVGWYATSSDLNTFSALIQNFYSQQGEGTFPHPAVHLTVSTLAGKEVEANTYISAPIGVTAERAADSCLFIPVPHEIKYSEPDKAALEAIAGARDREDRAQMLQTDVEVLERAIEQVLEMLERVSNYVSNVLDEEAEPSSALGQFLMNTLSAAPKVDAEDVERDLYVSHITRTYALTLLTCSACDSNNHIQDVLLVSYLANTIRTQIDLSNRLATAALTMGTGDAPASTSTDGQQKQGGDRQQRQGGQQGQQQRSGARPSGGRVEL